MYLCHVFFCYQAPNDQGGHSGQFSLHLSHQGNGGLEIGDRTRWSHLPTIPGTTPHCLVSTEGNVNFLGTRNLV